MRKIIKNAILATGASMMVVSGSNVFAATMDVSPVDKSSSKDTNGMIYDASYVNGNAKGHFWTDLGHYEVKDTNGNKVTDLYTPFFYHTKDTNWDPSSKNYNPVHSGDGSEMDCGESMFNITVGEMDRVLKALYQNDVSVYEAINGTIDDNGQTTEGIKQKLFTKIESKDLGNGKTQYVYKSESGKVIGTTYDTNTTNKSLIASKGKNSTLDLTLTDTDGKSLTANVDFLATKDSVQLVSTNLMQETKDRLSGDAELNGKLFKKITKVTSGNKTTYTYLDNSDKTIGTTDDYDTKITSNRLSFDGTKGELTSTIKDNTNQNYVSTVSGIASRDYVDSKVKEISSSIGADTNTKNSSISGSITDDGKLNVSVKDTDGNKVSTTIEGVATKKDISKVSSDITTIKSDVSNIHNDITNINKRIDNIKDTNTVTNVTTGDDWLKNEVTKSKDGNTIDNKLTFNEDKLKDYVKANSKDTVTKVTGSGLATVTETKTDSGYKYNVDVSEDKVKEIAKSVDTNTKNAGMSSTRDSAKGTAEVAVKDTDGNTVSTVIEDVASHKELKDYIKSNDKDKEVISAIVNNNSERITGLESKVNTLNDNVKQVGAHAAALAALHPLDYDEDDKLTFAAGYGNYRGSNAVAIGAFYRPNEDTMFNIGGSFGSGDGMINLGASFKLGPTPKNRKSKKELIEELDDLKAQVAELHEAVEAVLKK